MNGVAALTGGGRVARADRGFLLLMILPAAVLFGVFFAFPVLRLLALGFEGGSLAWYAKALSHPLYLQVFLITFEMAAAVTVACLLLGYPVAFLLANTTAGWRNLGFLFILLPLWTSILVRTYAWMVLLGRNGVVNKLLLAAGLTDHPLPLMYNFSGVLIGMVHVLLPYMVLPLYGALARVDRNVVQAAEGLGASRSAVLRRIYLPLTLNGIAAGSILVFVLSLGFFITPALLGGGRVVMIALLIQQQVGELLDWNFAAALSGLLLAATVIIYAIVQARIEARERGHA